MARQHGKRVLHLLVIFIDKEFKSGVGGGAKGRDGLMSPPEKAGEMARAAENLLRRLFHVVLHINIHSSPSHYSHSHWGVSTFWLF